MKWSLTATNVAFWLAGIVIVLCAVLIEHPVRWTFVGVLLVYITGLAVLDVTRQQEVAAAWRLKQTCDRVMRELDDERRGLDQLQQDLLELRLKVSRETHAAISSTPSDAELTE